MRTYNKEQQGDSVIFTGDIADKLKDARLEFDAAASEACKELHLAMQRVDQLFKEAYEQSEQRISSILRSSELAGVPLERIGFDFSLMEKHGIVIGRVREPQLNPIDILKAILSGDPQQMKDAGYVGEPFDGIFAEEISPVESSMSDRWKEPASS